MRAQLQRIRKANLSDIDKRVQRNNELIEVMTKCLTRNISTPIDRLAQSNKKQLKLLDLKGKIDGLKAFTQDVRENYTRFIKIFSTFIVDVQSHVMTAVKKKDIIIERLTERLAKCTCTTETQANGAMSHRTFCKKSETLSINTINHSNSQKFSLGQLRETPQKQLRSVQLNITDAVEMQNYMTNQHDTRIQQSSHKRMTSVHIDTSMIWHSYEDSRKIMKRQKHQTGNLLSREPIVQCQKDKIMEDVVNRFTTVSRIQTKGNRTDRVVNKENGPVLPKPLRKNSVDSRASKELGKYDLPPLSIPVFHKAPVNDGFGILLMQNQEIYRGLWKNGLFDGRGKLKGNGWIYQGQFRSGHLDGKGTLILEKGPKWIGTFVRSQAQGQGCFTLGHSSLTGIWHKGILVKNLGDTTHT